ncbi:BatA domain-containing protein [[Pseudomonas] boreopolis]|uniref:BatA domain-containing protein n=1 Tax=Xanthomonas boreopolis TaxID=86183 RepID=UPI003DA1520A
MNLVLLLPLGLAALAALLLPLLIHLARRSEHRPTPFAALRWLRAVPRPRHRVRFDEWPLLLVRLLLLALLALLLAQPALLGRDDRRPRIAVAPGVDPAQARAAVAGEADAHWLWLAPGFPDLATPAPDAARQQASLLRELDATLPAATPLTVVVPRRWGGLDGQVPVLSRRVRWQVVEAASPSPAAAKTAPPTLRVFADAANDGALRYLRAVQAAWHEDAALDVRPAADAAAAPPRDTAALWLSAAAPPASLLQWARDGGTLLLDARAPLPRGLALQPHWHDERGTAVVEGAGFGAGRVLRFARALDPVALPPLLDAAFPDLLRAVLQPPPPPQRAFASTQAPMTGATPSPAAPRSLAPWLALVAALLFLLERWLATSPRRGRSA